MVDRYTKCRHFINILLHGGKSKIVLFICNDNGMRTSNIYKRLWFCSLKLELVPCPQFLTVVSSGWDPVTPKLLDTQIHSSNILYSMANITSLAACTVLANIGPPELRCKGAFDVFLDKYTLVQSCQSIPTFLTICLITWCSASYVDYAESSNLHETCSDSAESITNYLSLSLLSDNLVSSFNLLCQLLCALSHFCIRQSLSAVKLYKWSWASFNKCRCGKVQKTVQRCAAWWWSTKTLLCSSWLELIAMKASLFEMKWITGYYLYTLSLHPFLIHHSALHNSFSFSPGLKPVSQILFPHSFTSSSWTAFTDYCPYHFFWATRFLFFLIFSFICRALD